MLPDPIFLNIHMYGVMIAVGILCAFLTLFYLTKKKGVDVRFTDFISRRTVSRPSTSRASYAALRGSVLICAVRCERISHFEKGLQAQPESVSYSIRRISLFNRICTRR